MQTYHHGDLRAALLEAGLALIQSEGLHGLSLRKVARVAGVSHAAPYHHFSDKTALMAALAIQGFEKLHQEIISRQPQTASEQLQGAAITYVGFAIENPELFRLMFSSELSRAERGADLETASAKAYHHITGMLHEESARIASWSLVHGLAMLLLERQIQGVVLNRQDAERLAQNVTQIFWEGLQQRMNPQPTTNPE